MPEFKLPPVPNPVNLYEMTRLTDADGNAVVIPPPSQTTEYLVDNALPLRSTSTLPAAPSPLGLHATTATLENPGALMIKSTKLASRPRPSSAAKDSKAIAEVASSPKATQIAPGPPAPSTSISEEPEAAHDGTTAAEPSNPGQEAGEEG